MVGSLFFLAVVGLIVYFVSRSSSNDRNVMLQMQLEQRNYEWAQFIANYYPLVHGKAQKELIRRMMEDIAAKGLAVPPLPVDQDARLLSRTSPVAELPASGAVMAVTTAPQVSQPVPMPVPTHSAQIDNATLLLYFGAFLFVASAGLFVAFGGLPGSIRTIIVLLVSLALYGVGVWLFNHKPRLKQAAFAFAGIGMAVAPLTGVAAYSYLFDNSNGSVVWLVTSVLCLALYGHALRALRSTLMGYLLICTFVSLVESGVSVVSVPSYYYGWALAMVGLLMSFLNLRTKFLQDVEQSAHRSAMIFVPLAVAASFVLIEKEGTGQLGVSLLIAATYYCLQAFLAKGTNERLAYAVATQGSCITGVAALVYSISDSIAAIGVTIAVLTGLQLILIVIRAGSDELWRSVGTVVLVSQAVGVLVCAGKPAMIVVSLAALVIAGAVVWLHQRRVDGYVVAMISWMLLPLVYGSFVVHPSLKPGPLTALCLAALSAQLGVYLLRFSGKPQETTLPGRYVYMLSATVVALFSLWSPAWWCFSACALIAVSMLYLGHMERLPEWPQAGGLFAALPLGLVLFPFESHPGVFLPVTVFALGYNIIAALWFREESNRWYVACLALVLPLSLGASVLGPWHQAQYAWAYAVVALFLIAARAVARGVLLASSNIPLASYARSASVSYSSGYVFALIIAVLLAFGADNSQLHGTLMTGLLTLLVLVLSRFIEKRSDILMLVPLLLQLLSWSVLRPSNVSSDMLLYVLVSIFLAGSSYAVPWSSTSRTSNWRAIQDGAILAAVIAPASVLFVGRTYWPMPFGLLMLSVMLYDRVRRTSQENRELVGALALTAVYWYLWFLNIRAPQAYVHLLVALFAAYAYCRQRRNERDRSDQYLVAMLATATVPLALQAIVGVAGGVYGWWLLLEQIGFMLIGMSIRRHFVTMWGLYVAVAAVLYQLRHLGWAALTVLALFLIGLATYRLQKVPKEKNSSKKFPGNQI